jgi:hypothetical protein
MDIYYEKHKPSGAWILTGIKDGYYTRQTYYGYNKREATRLFRQYLKSR